MAADIRSSLDEVQDLGIVQIQLVNKFDNALSGVKGDAGAAGVVVNNGNREETGHFWRFETCPEDRHHGGLRRGRRVATTTTDPRHRSAPGLTGSVRGSGYPSGCAALRAR